MATYSKIKEVAKERVKERIEPVLKHRKRTDTTISNTSNSEKSETETRSGEALSPRPTNRKWDSQKWRQQL